MEKTISLNKDLLNDLRQEDFKGYDPFDFLNSKIFQLTPFKYSKWFRLAWLQLGKNLPLNLRPLLLVPKKRNPKGIALIISGLIQDYKRTNEKQYLSEANNLAEWLLIQRCNSAKWKYSCWGYHFDWQARSFYVPVGKPNIITTYYVARSLYDLGKITNEEKFMTVALNSAKFMTSNLYQEQEGNSFFGYIPGEKTLVHNANLLGSAWCVFAGKQLNDTKMMDQGLKAARLSANEQTKDGAWLYGSSNFHNFIDGFHTGYNLEALSFIKDALKIYDFDKNIEIGYHYYLNNFFEKDGTVKYYNNSKYPLDMHSFAQAILTLFKVGNKNSDHSLSEIVINKAIELMYIPNKKRFIYQRRKWFVNKINYMRWTQAWSYYSLAYYNNIKSKLTNE